MGANLLGGAAAIWRWITLRRHRSELNALRAARIMRQWSIFPILFTVGMWWFVFCIPSLVLYLVGHALIDGQSAISRAVGSAVIVSAHVYALLALLVAAPWVFRWYFIAAEMTFGSSRLADKKEAELVAAIDYGSRSS